MLPLLGVSWLFAAGWDVQLLLPFSGQVKYRYTSDVTFGLGVNIHGNRFRFSDDQLSGGQSEVMNLRLTEVQVGADVNWKLKKDLLLIIETGITTASHVYITSGNGNIFSSGVKPALFLTMKLRFILNESAAPFENE